ncbi:MAG TPA: hypothetical protein DDX99_15110 [Desulfofustis sp.]|jgi:hypothetical protein|nr:hypothetical protein [Desulfofustis sp. PB-SRB1]HBH30139.1 hypothetical protein [Desulfofustis sp.]HBH32559.1 hypothetical protein [Desulfofustis sp.]
MNPENEPTLLCGREVFLAHAPFLVIFHPLRFLHTAAFVASSNGIYSFAAVPRNFFAGRTDHHDQRVWAETWGRIFIFDKPDSLFVL